MSKNMVEPQTSNNVTVWRICFACWIIKTTRKDTHTHVRTHAHSHRDKRVIFIADPRQQWLANAPQCYVICTLPVFFTLHLWLCVKEEKFVSFSTVFGQYFDTDIWKATPEASSATWNLGINTEHALGLWKMKAEEGGLDQFCRYQDLSLAYWFPTKQCGIQEQVT
jgi:hypothetical protein